MYGISPRAVDAVLGRLARAGFAQEVISHQRSPRIKQQDDITLARENSGTRAIRMRVRAAASSVGLKQERHSRFEAFTEQLRPK